MDIAPKHSLSLGNSEVAVAGVDSQPVIYFFLCSLKDANPVSEQHLWGAFVYDRTVKEGEGVQMVWGQI